MQTPQSKINNKDQMTLQQFLQGQSLDDVLHQTEKDIRQTPGDAKLRWLLFQLLRVLGDWTRALKQLQLCAQLQSELETSAQVYRALIRSELFRAQCLAGKRQPAFVIEPPPWMDQLLEAIALNVQGNEAAADDCREAALNATVDVAGHCNLGDFAWISDSDTWFGPVCELVVGGHYTWLPFEHIKRLQITPPASILDLLWTPVILTLIDHTELTGFILSRYCGSDSQSDPVRLCRETLWQESGRTTVRALGQKTWQTDRGDYAVLDIRQCRFDNATITVDPDDV